MPLTSEEFIEEARYTAHQRDLYRAAEELLHAEKDQLQADLDETDMELAQMTSDLLKTLAALAECEGTTPDPEPPRPGEPGSIDQKLIPTNGKILVGASTPSGDGTYNYTKGWAEYVAATGVEPSATHFYRSGNVSLITPAMLAASPGALLVINHKPAGSMGKAAYEKVLAGGADAAIRTAANSLLSYDKACHYLPQHEPENDNIDPVDPAVDILYRDSQKYIIDKLDALGVVFTRDGGKVAIGQNFMSFKEHIPRYDALYAAGYFDFIWGDPYCHSASSTLANFGSIVQFYAWAKKHELPIGWAEYGYDMRYESTFGFFSSQAAIDAMVKAFPLLKYLMYWNQSLGAGKDYRLSSVKGDAVKVFARNERFNIVVPPAMRAS